MREGCGESCSDSTDESVSRSHVGEGSGNSYPGVKYSVAVEESCADSSESGTDTAEIVDASCENRGFV